MIDYLRRAGYVVAFLLAGGFAAVHLAGENGIPALIAKQKQIRRLEELNRHLELRNEDLRKENDELKSNPDAQRRIVREELGYLLDGEEGFRTEGGADKPVEPPKDDTAKP
ncbi:MAG: septum formation initiator family protein [Bryobacterales bacterium]|nr:septum formation initiator family protein [Bryobacterales bacterium]